MAPRSRISNLGSGLLTYLKSAGEKWGMAHPWHAVTLWLLKWSLIPPWDELWAGYIALVYQAFVKFNCYGKTWLFLMALENVDVENKQLRTKNIWHGWPESWKGSLEGIPHFLWPERRYGWEPSSRSNCEDFRVLTLTQKRLLGLSSKHEMCCWGSCQPDRCEILWTGCYTAMIKNEIHYWKRLLK